MPIIVAACLASFIVITVVLVTYSSGLKKDFSSKVRDVVDQVNTTQFYQYELEKKSYDKLNSLENNVNNIRNNYPTKKDLADKVVTNTLDVQNIKQHDGIIDVKGDVNLGNAVSVSSTDKNVDIKIGTDSTLNIKNTAGKSLLTANENIQAPYAKIDRLQIGDKFQLSGVGDAHGNDGWLRLFDKNGTTYTGGLAMGSVWVGNDTYLNGRTHVNGLLNVQGNVLMKGGTSEHNPKNWQSAFPGGDNINYLRGDTEVRGNTQNIGDLTIGRDMNVKGRTTLDGNVRVKNMKVGHNWGGWTDNASLSAYSPTIGVSSCGKEFCSHFPWNADTFIRPGTTNGNIYIGDIGNTTNIELGDANTNTKVKGKLCFDDVCIKKDDVSNLMQLRPQQLQALIQSQAQFQTQLQQQAQAQSQEQALIQAQTQAQAQFQSQLQAQAQAQAQLQSQVQSLLNQQQQQPPSNLDTVVNSGTWTYKTERNGNDITNVVTNTSVDCARECAKNTACKAMAWDTAGSKTCWLKSSPGTPTAWDQRDSWVRGSI